MISARLARRDSWLFVYGTLRPFVDIEMAKWLRSHARYVGPAATRGRLYDLGAYPGMRSAPGRGQRVVGDVYRVTNSRVFRVLDRYEHEFVRKRCVVKLDRGGCRIAWAYRYRYGVARAPRIASGDYRVHRREERVIDTPEEAPMPTQCSAEQLQFSCVERRRVVAAFDGGEALRTAVRCC